MGRSYTIKSFNYFLRHNMKLEILNPSEKKLIKILKPYPKISIPSLSKLLQVKATFNLNESRNKRLPYNYEKLVAAFTYVIPALNASSITLSLFKWWTSMSWAWFILEPISILYTSSSFTPLIVFFLLLLSIVRNKRFHHLVRFHALQSAMVDIAITLVSVVRMCLPPELRWSMFMVVIDRYVGASILMTITYCTLYAISGQYAAMLCLSEAVYVQVDILESFSG